MRNSKHWNGYKKRELKRNCHFCGERGHHIRTCPERSKKGQTKYMSSKPNVLCNAKPGSAQISIDSGISQSNCGAVLMAQTQGFIVDFINERSERAQDTAFIASVDSAASDDMIESRTFMHNLIQIQPREIILGDGTCVMAEPKKGCNSECGPLCRRCTE